MCKRCDEIGPELWTWAAASLSADYEYGQHPAHSTFHVLMGAAVAIGLQIHGSAGLDLIVAHFARALREIGGLDVLANVYDLPPGGSDVVN